MFGRVLNVPLKWAFILPVNFRLRRVVENLTKLTFSIPPEIIRKPKGFHNCPHILYLECKLINADHAKFRQMNFKVIIHTYFFFHSG